MSQLDQIIGANVRLYRRANRLTLEELAARIHKSKATLGKYEQGTIAMDVNTLWEIARALQLEPGQLMETLEPPEEKEHPAQPAYRQYVYLYDGRTSRLMRSLLVGGDPQEEDPPLTLIYDVPSFEELHMTVMDFLKNHRLKAIYTEKKSQYVVYFVYGSNRFSPATVMAVGNFISSQYEIYGKHMIAAGDAATGIAHAYQSYTSAVILLQSSFFFPAGTLLTTSVLENASGHTAKATWTQTPELTFSKLLSGNEKDCMQFLSDLFCFYNCNHTYMPNQVKDLYYRLFSVLYNIRKKMQLPSTGKQEAIVDILERAFTYNELHQALVSLVDTYFEDSGNSQPENSTIFQIREFISKNYMNDTLSVKDISNHVFLSASYVCTFFKSETGQTLNQYLTEYRMEKAKQLLTDPRYKISEISSKVGYTDGNYFGKSFKKYTGLSPSEYREKMS